MRPILNINVSGPLFFLFLGAIALMFAQGHLAWANPPQEKRLPSKEVAILSDTMEIFQKKGVVVFSGNVRATRGAITLETVRLTVFQAPSSTPTSGTRSDKIQSLKAEGHVRITAPGQTISGKTATVDMEKNLLTVEGDVVVDQPGGLVRGPKLEVDLRTQHSKMLGGRVSGTFRETPK